MMSSNRTNNLTASDTNLMISQHCVSGATGTEANNTNPAEQDLQYKTVETVLSNRNSLLVANHARKYAESISSASVYSDLAFGGSQKQFQEIGALQEHKILCKGLLYILLPACIFGCLAMFFPSLYVLYPLQESGYCICSFYEL